MYVLLKDRKVVKITIILCCKADISSMKFLQTSLIELMGPIVVIIVLLPPSSISIMHPYLCSEKICS